MKQHITREQWDELERPMSDRYVGFFIDRYGLTYWPATPGASHERVDIGQMIEFLGEDLCGMEQMLDMKHGLEKESIVWVITLEKIKFKGDELCDPLWEAVKHKLKQ